MEWIKDNPILIPASIVALITSIGCCIAIGRWIGRRESFENVISGFKKSLEDSMKEIQVNINKIFLALPSQNPAVSSSSPLRLTELGQSISEFLNAKAWAKSESNKIPAHTRKIHPYEIQQFCFDYVDDFVFLDDFTRKMQQCAYEKGTTVIEVKKVLAIELRDFMLEMAVD